MNPSDDSDRLRREAEQWWLRLRDRGATRGDAEAFKLWRASSPSHARAWNEVARLWQEMDPVLKQAASRDPGLAHPSARRPVNPGRRAFFGTAVAAGGAALAVWPPLSLWPSLLDYTADFRTGTAEQRSVALSEALTVQMNTQTRINRRAAMDAGKAIELVAGEAQVDAAGGGEAVTVYAGAGATHARQARFNLRYTGPQVCVTCLQGSVAVEQAGRRQTLEPGQQLYYDESGLRAAVPADMAMVEAWRSGTLSFSGQTLAEVVDEINRYRPGRVLLRNAELAARRVRMRFAITQTDLALRMLRDLYGAQLTQLPGGIVLLS
ncbi:FecR domain-containing protein [Achromobacter sp. Marseille-Q0513]|uniref:FecR family protein n=1 Tax=Achromobacter sp. Marseille-Q0513 TaxID=2829161 RepID=UPI001B9386CC|nr:FecR domain-containing protein [Achromobacter sp. Marseille-Q0513]MBR8653494.1 FecR domain-containing protein [Achromobacter sp. Marseille-Q0513]